MQSCQHNTAYQISNLADTEQPVHTLALQGQRPLPSCTQMKQTEVLVSTLYFHAHHDAQSGWIQW